MINRIINWLLNSNKDTYSDEYGIYDIETGLMYEYFVPVPEITLLEKKEYLINTLDIKESTANIMLGIPEISKVGKTQLQIIEDRAEYNRLMKVEIKNQIKYIEIASVYRRGIDWAEISTSERLTERDIKGLFEIKDKKVSITDLVAHGMGTIFKIDLLDTDLQQCDLIIDSIRPGDKIKKIRVYE